MGRHAWQSEVRAAAIAGVMAAARPSRKRTAGPGPCRCCRDPRDHEPSPPNVILGTDEQEKEGPGPAFPDRGTHIWGPGVVQRALGQDPTRRRLAYRGGCTDGPIFRSSSTGRPDGVATSPRALATHMRVSPDTIRTPPDRGSSVFLVEDEHTALNPGGQSGRFNGEEAFAARCSSTNVRIPGRQLLGAGFKQGWTVHRGPLSVRGSGEPSSTEPGWPRGCNAS